MKIFALLKLLFRALVSVASFVIVFGIINIMSELFLFGLDGVQQPEEYILDTKLQSLAPFNLVIGGLTIAFCTYFTLVGIRHTYKKNDGPHQ
jgi:hypothetical protein